MRRFVLENKYGVTFQFTYFNKVLFTNISGLGFSKNYTYLKYDNHFSTLKNNFELSEIRGVITFLDGYQGYKKMLSFLEKGQHDMKLHYESHDMKYCYVDIVSLTKTELKTGGLQSEIVLNKKSFWIKERSVLITSNVDTGGKIYPYTYSFIYSNASMGLSNVEIGGHIKANVVVEIIGSIDEPELLVKRNGVVSDELRLLMNRTDAHIVVSSLIQELTMFEIINDEKHDIYRFQDFDKENLLWIEPGAIEFEFKPGVSEQTICKIKIFEYYLG